MEEIIFEFQKTEIYRDTINYVTLIYDVSNYFPKTELYRLTNQIRRASVSIALNFAEGWGRYNKKEKSQFYKIARASIFEYVTAADIALKQSFIENQHYEQILKESKILSKKFNGLIKSLGKYTE